MKPDAIIVELRKRRLALGVSQAMMARALGHGRGAVTNWENGHRNPSLFVLHDWADALGCDVMVVDRGVSDDLDDEVVVGRALLGERLKLTAKDRSMVAARLYAAGKSVAEIARIIGRSPRQIHRNRTREQADRVRDQREGKA